MLENFLVRFLARKYSLIAVFFLFFLLHIRVSHEYPRWGICSAISGICGSWKVTVLAIGSFILDGRPSCEFINGGSAGWVVQFCMRTFFQLIRLCYTSLLHELCKKCKSRVHLLGSMPINAIPYGVVLSVSCCVWELIDTHWLRKAQLYLGHFPAWFWCKSLAWSSQSSSGTGGHFWRRPNRHLITLFSVILVIVTQHSIQECSPPGINFLVTSCHRTRLTAPNEKMLVFFGTLMDHTPRGSSISVDLTQSSIPRYFVSPRASQWLGSPTATASIQSVWVTNFQKLSRVGCFLPLPSPKWPTTTDSHSDPEERHKYPENRVQEHFSPQHLRTQPLFAVDSSHTYGGPLFNIFFGFFFI